MKYEKPSFRFAYRENYLSSRYRMYRFFRKQCRNLVVLKSSSVVAAKL